MLAILLLGLALRLAAWGQNRFLEDEALYAYWGLQIATGADPMLNYEPVDKPPLHAYTLAVSFLLFGQVETAARLPSLFASAVGIALVYALGRNLPHTRWGRGGGGERAALLVAFLLALSPFDILFASTAFTDPLLTVWVLAALLAAAKGRLGAAGLLTGLAAATKQQGLFFLPLVVAVGVSTAKPFRAAHNTGANARVEKANPRWSWFSRHGAWAPQHAAWLRFFVAFAFIVVAILCWDAARVQRPGFFEQSLISYGGLGPAQPQALGERAAAWLRLVGDFWVSPWVNGMMIGAVAWFVGLVLGTWGIRLVVGSQAARSQFWSGIELYLLVFIIVFLAVHCLLGFQVWDRYLLAIVPLAALLAARAFVALGQIIRVIRWRMVYATGLPLLLALALLGPVLQATHSELPIGGDHGAYDGIDELAAYLRREAPPGSVLYHYWLGYHYRFYLYDAPLRLHWYPNLEDLAHDAFVYRREPRYIAFPSWRDDGPARSALTSEGISLEPAFETMRRDGTVSFRLYRLAGP
jgi:4-amino-4-deoxy-L-arabinose transferase-like glycosyltransferase